MDQTYLNKVNFKLLLEWNHCITDCPQKEREISFCYFTCICVGETVFHLKTKRHFKCTCSPDLSVALFITQIKIYVGGKRFPASPLAKLVLSCPIGLQEVLLQHHPC